MKYFIELPKVSQNMLDCYIKELQLIGGDNVEYEIYDSPSLYIIYLKDELFNKIERRLDKILDENYEKYLNATKGVLYSPESFKVSYEEKIECKIFTPLLENNVAFFANESARIIDETLDIDWRKIESEELSSLEYSFSNICKNAINNESDVGSKNSFNITEGKEYYLNKEQTMSIGIPNEIRAA